VNKVILMGRLGADPDYKPVSAGHACNLSVATVERWKDKDGSKKERTEWHRIVVYGPLADACAKHVSKGSQVLIEGRLHTRSWEDKDGKKKYQTEVIAASVTFLDS
jgi:single-strand DNA-binding protein